MCVQNFIKIGAGVRISINPPHTNRHAGIPSQQHVETGRKRATKEVFVDCGLIYIYLNIFYMVSKPKDLLG